MKTLYCTFLVYNYNKELHQGNELRNFKVNFLEDV